MFQISVHHLSYGLPDGKSLFQDLNFTLPKGKTGLLGDNGTGKTTLLRMLAGELQPDAGTIAVQGRLAMVHQQRTLVPGQRVDAFLEIAGRRAALRRILAGEGSPQDLVLLDDDWDLETRVADTMRAAGLEKISLARLVNSLSGGELSRLALAAAWLKAADFILLDEPTNHLDQASRARICEMIGQTKADLLIVSHDRTLLRQMDHILELSALGLRLYGGNFDAYAAQKQQEQAAAVEALNAARHRLALQEKRAHAAAQKQARRTSSAKQGAKGQRIPKSSLNYMKGQAEKTAHKGSALHDARLAARQDEVAARRQKVASTHQIQIDLQGSQVHAGKALIQLEAVQFAFPDSGPLWRSPLDFALHGTERAWLRGPNGSGKSTLLALIQGTYVPSAGRVRLGTSRLGLLDQELAFLDAKASLLDNLRRFAPPGMPEHALRMRLARFLFRDDKVFQRVDRLSGGERLRLGLACLLIQAEPPELLILDEPTNNLDLRSVAEMVQVLRAFPGALLLVSHDVDFVKEVGTDKEWVLES